MGMRYMRWSWSWSIFFSGQIVLKRYVKGDEEGDYYQQSEILV